MKPTTGCKTTTEICEECGFYKRPSDKDRDQMPNCPDCKEKRGIEKPLKTVAGRFEFEDGKEKMFVGFIRED